MPVAFIIMNPPSRGYQKKNPQADDSAWGFPDFIRKTVLYSQPGSRGL
jgi:hypothetical protein